MSDEILAPIFEKRMTLDCGGDNFGIRAMSVWEHMADTLDQIAANTRGGGSVQAVAASLSKYASGGKNAASLSSILKEPARNKVGTNSVPAPSGESGMETRPALVRSFREASSRPIPTSQFSSPVSTPSAIASPSVLTKSQQASMAGRESRATEQQGNLIADAVLSGFNKIGAWGVSGMNAAKEDSDAKDAAGYALAGPLYGVVKDLQQALPDSMKERREDTRHNRSSKATDAKGTKRDSKGRFVPDRETVRREMAQIELAEDELALQEREAKAEEKRHKELVRAIRTADKKGLLDHITEGRRGRDRVIRETDRRDRDHARDRNKSSSSDADLDVGREKGRRKRRTAQTRTTTRRVGTRGGLLGRLGGIGRTTGATVGTLTTGATGGLLGGAGRATTGAGRTAARAGKGALALGAKGMLGAAKAVPVAGQILAAGMALYDGFQGWNDTEMQREAFGLSEGQEATTGQKTSAAIANTLDMGGLGTGLLGLLGIEVSTGDIARNIYSLGNNIATAGQNFATSFEEKASVIWASVTDMGASIWSGAQQMDSAIVGFVGSAFEKSTELLVSATDGAAGLLKDCWDSTTSFVQAGLAKGGEMLSSLWESATDKASNLASNVVAGAKDIASSAIAEGEKILSAGMEAVSDGAAWVGEKADSAWEGAKNMASSGWEAAKGFGGSLLDSIFGSSEAEAAESVQAPVGTLSSPQTAEALAQPDAGSGLLSGSSDTQEEMTEAMSSVDEAMQEQNKLLSNIEKNLDIAPDTYGIAGALGGVQDAIRSVRAGGGTGYVSTGASGNNPGFAYNPDSKIGDTIAHEESGAKGVKAIGFDRNGGTSYGKWQLSSRQGGLEEWLQLLEEKGGEAAEIAKRLRAAGPTNTGSRSGAFVDAYLKEASANSELFENTQRESLLKHNYNPAMSRLQSDSLRKMIEGDKSLQEMMFSTAVQHGGGGAAKILNDVYREGMSREDLIRAVYAKRGGQFGASTAQVQQAALSRMDRERDLILGMNRGEANVKNLRERMSKGGNEAVQAGVSTMIAEATEDAKARNVRYLMGGKDSSTGAIDCSGWVQEMGNQMMAGMNEAIGEEVFSAEVRQAFNKGAQTEGAAGIVRAVSEQTGQLYTNEQLTPEQAKEGMVIGLDTGRRGWEAGRFKDIDHVVQTYRDPVTGELMVSESRGGKGVMSSRYADWYGQQQKRGTKLYGADLTAMADSSRVAPTQSSTLAENTAAQQVVQKAAEAEGSRGVRAMSVQRGNPPALAETATTSLVPESVPQIAPETARSGRLTDSPEAVRTILPPQAMTGASKEDNSALLVMLGKILAAIEAGNRKMAGAAADVRDGVPSIGMDYDEPSMQGMARDSA